MSGINEAYVNALPDVNGKPKTTLDARFFRRFDTALSVSFSVRVINVIGNETLPDRMSIRVNEACSVAVLTGDAENGFELRRMKGGYLRFVGASEVIRFLIEKGVRMPVKAKLAYDGQLGGWVARLPRGNSL
ncbi:MAG TPA: hypothetical protein PK854_11650 [Oscillospiraceae bacterium]|nr:hypothetical protein [Oscillospiraceae bacterium]